MRATALVALCLLAASCGLRTARTPDQAALGSGTLGGPAQGQPGQGPLTNPGQPAVGVPGANGNPGSYPGSTGGGTNGPGTIPTTGPSGGPTGQAALTGRGVTAKTIQIGFAVSKNLQAGFAAVGASGSPPNESDIVAALVKWVNATGGIAGRTLIPVYHEVDETSGTWASQAAATCAAFTQDAHVFAVGSSPVGGSDALLGCLAAAHTPDIEQNLWLFDSQYYKQYPGILYQPGKARPDRWVKAYVDGLSQAGFWSSTAKVGLLRFDAPVFNRMTANVLKPEVARLGHKIDAEIAISEPGSVSDFGAMAASLQNAIVSLQTAGINHVMFLENAGEMPFFFMEQAESQQYRPTYGLSSEDIPTTLEGQESANQLKGSITVGWTPPNDVDSAYVPKGNANYDLCRKVMLKYGETNLSGFYIQSLCDTVMFLRAAVPRMTTISTEGFAAAVAGLGSSYTSPFTFNSIFGPGRSDGASLARIGGFVDSCGCFKYTNTTVPMG